MKRILFVDDESKVLDGLRRTLHSERHRWEMEFVTSGEDALKALETSVFDVVLSDMKMAGMDGATLLGHVRDRFPYTARIILSGHTEPVSATRVASIAHRFLSKPCSVADLHLAIERVCALQSLVHSPEIRQIIGSVGALPTLSRTYINLTEALKDPNTPISRVAAIVEQDAAMSAKILQLTNSAFFGMAQRGTNLTNAVSYLGMETIKNLALASEAFRVFIPDSRVPQSVCDSIQRHALTAAAIARQLPVERNARDITVLAVLLHDIGKLFLASKMPEKFCLILSNCRTQDCSAFQAEEELLGTTHAEIGAYLLGLWGIPNLAVEAIAHHHRPTRIPHSEFDSTVAVYLADLLAHETSMAVKGSAYHELADYDRDCMESLGVLDRLEEFRQLAVEADNAQRQPVRARTS